MSAPARPRRPTSEAVVAPAAEAPSSPPPRKGGPRPPTVLDFLPLEEAKETRLSRFFVRLREGRLSTTRCPKDDLLLWPPRVACPRCHTETLEWTDLPETGRIYAFSAVLAGAPLGMESDVPFAVGLVDLDGVPLRLYGRIEGRPWNLLRVGEPVRVEPYEADADRAFYRFRTLD